MRCNCENSKCPICDGCGCKNQAGRYRAIYIGGICDGCAFHMPNEYLTEAYMTRHHAITFEEELSFRGDHYMVEAVEYVELLGPWDEEGNRWPLCDPFYIFRVYGYNELTQNYEIDITEMLTAAENDIMQCMINEHYRDQMASYLEQREERRNDR